jgi:hypothetical protein
MDGVCPLVVDGDEHASCLTHGNRINRTTFVQVSSLFDFPSSLLPQADHSFHIPITTIHHMALINALQLPLKKFFCPQDWCLTHTQYSPTQPQLSGVQLQQLPSTSISFPKLIFTSIACIKGHGAHSWQYCGHHQSL